MGGSTSEVNGIIADANKVTSYYADLLLQDSPLPLVLNYYENYNKQTEQFFNKTRREKMGSLNMSYHDFYNQLAYLNYTYEQPINNNELRKKIILQIFDRSYKVQKHLIADLYDLCKNKF